MKGHPGSVNLQELVTLKFLYTIQGVILENNIAGTRRYPTTLAYAHPSVHQIQTSYILFIFYFSNLFFVGAILEDFKNRHHLVLRPQCNVKISLQEENISIFMRTQILLVIE